MAELSTQKANCKHSFPETSCSNCNLRNLCLDMDDIDRINKIIKRERPIQSGDHLFRSGDPFTSIFAVRSGSVKTYLIDSDGLEQVTGFYLPGEMIGFDGINSNYHACNVVALETVSLCEIPFDRLEELSCEMPVLQHHFFQLMSRQIGTDHQMMLTLSKKNAEGRIATLLVSLSERYCRLQLSPTAMRLPMSRMDIGNFLGLTIETVSRTFSRLQKNGVITVDGREIIIQDRERLNGLCHGSR